ncbi:hypothetical protein CHISP_0054 [Chitinispirillum alkaliphilum]|nr:hypothetical protein CHISP_0054 [Chitinispirillum alkaliphilum]
MDERVIFTYADNAPGNSLPKDLQNAKVLQTLTSKQYYRLCERWRFL